MFEPAVRYVTTPDGVRIAYTVTGEGPPHVFVTEPVVSHVSLEWQQPIFKRIYGTLAKYNTLVRFDGRGTGLSDRQAPFNAEQRNLDVSAVTEAVGLDTYALTVVQSPTPAVIEHVAASPGRVTRFVTVNGFLRTEDFQKTAQIVALTAAGAVDFVLRRKRSAPSPSARRARRRAITAPTSDPASRRISSRVLQSSPTSTPRKLHELWMSRRS